MIKGHEIMNFRILTLGGLMLALAGCTTTGGIAGNPLEARWNGKSAGTFFAAYGPPISDVESGSSTVFTWRGGYKTVRVPAKHEEGQKGKKGKRIAPAKTVYLRCEARITVGQDYTIRSIQAIADRPGVNGPSYCAEFLDAAKK